MRQPLLLQYYQLLPDQKKEESQTKWARLLHKGLGKFKRSIESRYNEASLARLLQHESGEVRQAAVLALGLVGTMKINATLAGCLHDEDPAVNQLAADALWAVWFRADSPDHNEELQRLMLVTEDEVGPEKVLMGFTTLIRKSPRFAEAYNQRAIANFRQGNYAKSIADCEKALRLNPYHFGAASGMGQCFMKQRKLRAALRTYRRANRINPHLDGVKQVIESLERMLGEEGKR